ncbi:MAG: NYN domain-containing protein [Proteobacteria bacterium]|nr:NYN domain-containing protein [Pseudomonadota bacterium]
MLRVIAYVDGFNLYFGLKQAYLKRYFWLDVAALARSLLKPGQRLESTHFFTARIRDNGHNAADQKRQNDYLEALALHGVQCQFGHYLQQNRVCRSCKATWLDYEEKMTDVNIAIQLLTDAFDDIVRCSSGHLRRQRSDHADPACARTLSCQERHRRIPAASSLQGTQKIR